MVPNAPSTSILGRSAAHQLVRSSTLAVNFAFSRFTTIDQEERNEAGEILPTIRNFPLQKGVPFESSQSVYKRLQETLNEPVPKFEYLTAFNYAATVP